MNFLAPEMIVNLVPRANVDIDELVASGHRSMALYNKMIGRVERWLDKFADDEKVTIADLFKAYALLAPVLESLVVIRAKIGEQRAAEARDVTAQMQTDLQEGVKREAPKIQETLELMRRRFDDIMKARANLSTGRSRS
jgi:type I site-specific restriction endonuclease